MPSDHPPLYVLPHIFNRSVIVISPMNVIVDEREQHGASVDDDVPVHQRSGRTRSLGEEGPDERQKEKKNRHDVAEHAELPKAEL